ncbi:type II toxin-antitoxin system Phd/YefM family antitoxin [Tumidithrix elongata RA019]|uniref:Antitoxin n=1 Tax=Tumidithrix elongata BACA0141 TaxID=2716417 RepID=A0AAW9QAL1_9CYAN|nr:type II toxin-antitoxin system Phd/YefM family antitoxin [Tumidithrix elongata RA019]
MINLKNIHSLSDFKRNAKEFIERVKATQSPLVLTVNGKAEVVIQDARAFQAICDRIEQVESELRTLKLATLKQDINLGISQLDNGDYAEYDDDTLPTLLESIKTRGQNRLQQLKDESV